MVRLVRVARLARTPAPTKAKSDREAIGGGKRKEKQNELVHFDTPSRVADLTTCAFAGVKLGRCIQKH